MGEGGQGMSLSGSRPGLSAPPPYPLLASGHIQVDQDRDLRPPGALPPAAGCGDVEASLSPAAGRRERCGTTEDAQREGRNYGDRGQEAISSYSNGIFPVSSHPAPSSYLRQTSLESWMEACCASTPRRRDELGAAIADGMAEVLASYTQVCVEAGMCGVEGGGAVSSEMNNGVKLQVWNLR